MRHRAAWCGPSASIVQTSPITAQKNSNGWTDWLANLSPHSLTPFELRRQRTHRGLRDRRGCEPRYVRQALERPACIDVAALDCSVESAPIEQIDVRQRGLQDDIGKGALRRIARYAVDHAGVHQDLENVDAPLAA